jgi:eukaryotic-like serine/threonine-protein kinase
MPEWLGQTIGNVRIEKLLARGGMAEVYLGTHLNLERSVAIKFLHSYIEEEPLLLERFRREARVVAALRHPNIVQIFDFDTADGHPFIVMEYLKGPTLATYLRHLHQRKKRIPSDQVARLLNELSRALDYAHGQGVVHRDIKPGNIMLHNKSEDMALDRPLTDDVEAVLTDFGLVRIMNASSQTASGTVSGTPAYMSPEQARGDPTDHRTDIYSLGIVLYEMLAGRVPFEADSTLTILHMQIHTPPSPIPGIPASVQSVIDRALQKNPDDRYKTSRELASDYASAIGLNAPVMPVPEPHPVRPVPSETLVPATPETKQETKREPAPEKKSEPAPKPKPEPVSKSEPTPKAEQTPKPARNRLWLGVGLLSLVCLALLIFAGPRLLALLPNSPPASDTLSPAVTNTAEGNAPSPAPDFPPADGMVQVSAGTYEVGLSPADDYHVTPQSVSLPDFWIDQYLITNAKYEQYMTETNAPPPMTWPGEPDHPVIGVTWEQASAYCQWIKKRLPDESEWEAAGRGTGTPPQLYPWGNDITAEGQALQLPDQETYPVGTLSFNQSPFGVFDMVGNVWEWVGEPYANGQEGIKFLRGGRYGLPVNDLAYRLAVAPGDDRYVRYASFRCAADEVR